MVFDRQVWCAMAAEDEILALSYAAFEKENNEWEIGGLMVAEQARGKGLGEIMMRLPLINLLVTERPLKCVPSQTIVTHVLKGNEGPRGIIPKCGLAFAHSVKIPKEALPGLKHDADDMVHGDEFHLQIPDGIEGLAGWLDGWDQCLRDGTPASIDLVDHLTINSWSRALRSMI